MCALCELAECAVHKTHCLRGTRVKWRERVLQRKERREQKKTKSKRRTRHHSRLAAWLRAAWPRLPRNSTRTARCGAPSRSAASPSAPPSGPITSAARSASRAPRARRTAPPTTWIGSAASIPACDSCARSPAPCSPAHTHLDAGRSQALRRPQVIPLSSLLPNFVSMSTSTDHRRQCAPNVLRTVVAQMDRRSGQLPWL